MMEYNLEDCNPADDPLPMLQTVARPKTLKESALAQLREAITLGALKPGQRIVERVMCEQLGVSRTVIRECIRHLESERLVTTIPNAGPTVATLSAADISEIYAIRALLEAGAVRCCTEKADDDVLVDLQRRHDEIAERLEQQDVNAALEATTGFYECIFVAGEKQVSWDLVRQLNGRISWLRALTLSSQGRSTAGPKSIQRIIKAMSDRNVDAAVAACEAHIADAARIALQEWQRTTQESDES